MFSRPTLQIPLLAVLFGLLIGCAPAPVKEPKPVITPEQTLLLNQAAELEAAGDYLGAGALYEQLTATADPLIRDRYRVLAADNLVRGGDAEGAADLMQQLQRYKLKPRDFFLAQLIDAEIQLARSLPAEALVTLKATPPMEAEVALLARYRRDRAEAFRLTGDPLNSARELSELDLLPEETPGDRLENQLRLVRTLTALPQDVLQFQRPIPATQFTGWMDLARVLQDYAAGADPADPGMALWRRAYPTHPVLPELIGHYLDSLRQEMIAFDKIAVLLPAGGRYAAASAAVRDGLLAAYYNDHSGHRPSIAFYDSSNSADVWPLLQQAVAEGAGAVIGPLQKESVEQLAQAGSLDVPVLALNRISLDTLPPEELYQFGLAPEDEARQAAERAWQDGAGVAIALVPEGDWGERLLNAFRERWEALGGHLAEAQTYDPKQNDFSDILRDLLNLDESEARHQALVRTLGQRLEFEPHRRSDAGALFLAANAAKARALWPQLQFHRAGDLPVYTTSHIYSGRFSRTTDLDLAGLTFADIPWLLDHQSEGTIHRDTLPESLQQRSGALARLFAMGMDSYRLLGGLKRLKEFPGASLPGATGELSLNELNQIHRRLVWAKMTDQGPALLDVDPVRESAESHAPAKTDETAAP